MVTEKGNSVLKTTSTTIHSLSLTPVAARSYIVRTFTVSWLLLGALDLLLEDFGEVVGELVVVAERRLERRQQRFLLLLQPLDVFLLRAQALLNLDDLVNSEQ